MPKRNSSLGRMTPQTKQKRQRRKQEDTSRRSLENFENTPVAYSYSHRGSTMMETREMPEPVVLIIQPTTDDLKNELAKECSDQALSQPASGSSVSDEYHLVTSVSDQYHIVASGSSVAGDYVIKLEKADSDEQGLLIPPAITTKVDYVEVKPELEFNIKQENVNKMTDSFDVNADFHPDVVPECQLEYDNPGSLIVKREHPEDIAQQDSTLEETGAEFEVTEAIQYNDVEPLPTSDANIEDTWPQSDTVPANEADGRSISKLSQILLSDDERSYCKEINVEQNSKERGLRNGRKLVSCNECGKRFTTRLKLIKHQRVHNGDKPFSCQVCGKHFSLKGDLKRHQEVHKPFSCSECGMRFTTNKSLKRHTRLRNRAVASSSGRGKCFTNICLKTQQLPRSAGSAGVYCTECGKWFPDRSNLVNHLRVHSGEKPFSCTECGKSFSLRGNLKTHQRLHSGVKPFSCDECGKRFTQRHTLTRHQGLHIGEIQFWECDGLKVYQRLHNEEKPLSCNECGKHFTQHGNLLAHQRLHRDKHFSCDVCGKRFFQRPSVIRHQSVHTREKNCSVSSLN